MITWEEKPTGLEACIFTPLSLSGQAGEGLETFSEHISSLMLEIFAILTMVRLNRIVCNKTCFLLYIKAKRRAVLCLFTQKQFFYSMYIMMPVKMLLLLTCIFGRMPVIFLSLYINSSTTCRKESLENWWCADQCGNWLTPAILHCPEGRLEDDVLVGFWCFLGWTK